jgi:hypothetical protein
MADLNPNKLHVNYKGVGKKGSLKEPRVYTLTHSDVTGELFLTIGMKVNKKQISGIYTQLMRDEVVAEWQFADQPVLHVHCHVSGGLVFGTARWRKSIFKHHMSMVLQAFRYGDRFFFERYPGLDKSEVMVHYHASQKRLDTVETYKQMRDYRIVTRNETRSVS